MRNELNQSMDHFKRAASLAAQETSATVGPKFYAAKDRVQPAATKAKDAATNSWDTALAALTPLAGAASETVRHTGKVTKKQAKKQAKAVEKAERKAEKKAAKATGRQKKGRTGRLAGYALLGTAVGMGAAYYARRKRDAQWEEYDTTSTVQTGADDAAFEPIEPTVYTTSNGTVTDQTKPGPR
ncbi:hypothetical protein [Actinoplanes aureus]|uniref:Uncharacterized protein n=1 Tax=Actinoplanes aureus TaxID=2792083 RepID=A0A931FVW7_9ACTN|nr:hypothetical protein [Actinoplanes aureus]MBG0560685.1 hypothetical protein [Actinoplanes aureus]